MTHKNSGKSSSYSFIIKGTNRTSQMKRHTRGGLGWSQAWSFYVLKTCYFPSMLIWDFPTREAYLNLRCLEFLLWFHYIVNHRPCDWTWSLNSFSFPLEVMLISPIWKPQPLITWFTFLVDQPPSWVIYLA